MSSPRNPYEYLLFDRLLVSEIELNLLQPFPQDALTIKPSLRLTLESEPLAPGGDLVMGGPEHPTEMYFDGSQTIFSLRSVNRVVAVDSSGLNIALHFHPDQSSPPRYDSDQAVGDRIVTSVLSRLPILWESPAYHGATLSWGAGTVVLLGESGVGKSTLSQHLVRDHGAILHDDDTALLEWVGGLPIPVPMGGSPRLRSDAAAHLQLEGTMLVGFAGNKIALATEKVAEIPRLSPVQAIFEIVAISETSQPSSEDPSGIRVEDIDPVRAIPSLWRYLFTTNLGKLQSTQRFRMAHALTGHPLTRISYTRGKNKPAEVAALIAEQIVARQ